MALTREELPMLGYIVRRITYSTWGTYQLTATGRWLVCVSRTEAEAQAVRQRLIYGGGVPK